MLTSQEEVESFPVSKVRSSLTLGRPHRSFDARGPFSDPALTDGPSGYVVAEEGRSKLFCVGGL